MLVTLVALCAEYTTKRVKASPPFANKGFTNYGTQMSEELFDKICNEIIPHGNFVEMIILYGRGEALLDKNLEEKIEKLRNVGVKRIQLSTNGALLTAERAKKIFAAGLNDLRLSIDSVRKDVYEKIRVGLNYDTVIKNTIDTIGVRNKYYPDIPIRIRAVEMEENKDEKEEWITFWNKHIKDIDTAQFMMYSPKTASESNINDERTEPCISPFSTMVIRCDGEVHLCCADFTGAIKLGNICNSTIRKVWQSDTFKNIRNLHLSYKWSDIPFCRGCTIWE